MLSGFSRGLPSLKNRAHAQYSSTCVPQTVKNEPTAFPLGRVNLNVRSAEAGKYVIFQFNVIAYSNITKAVTFSDVDFPYLNSIPITGFKCVGKLPGYYADDHPLARCQVFHYCHHDGRLFNFLCPNNTVFNQKYFACDHYFNFDCSTAKDFYKLNDNLFKISSDEGIIPICIH
uniref:Chitin-binding type-2 domain-containing protein n=1 Tax=Strigamia maritima TaxID=126957 RepID=T1J0R5_STRMM